MSGRLIEPGANYVETAALADSVEQKLPDCARDSTRLRTAVLAIVRRSIRALAKTLDSCARVVFEALHEIFDESAYARFLSRRQLASSRAAYAAFCQESEVAKARRPRCC